MNTTDSILQALTAKAQRIRDDPKNKSGGDSLYALKPAARRKLTAINWEITARLRELRIERGEEINDAGYSGRNTNRR